jgi:mRNA interferase RelE/StbE
MQLGYTPRAIEALEKAPDAIRRRFFKQVTFLAGNLHHPSLRAKKYDESRNLWQARVNRNWRFYFKMEGNTYIIEDIIPHPK